MLTPWTIRNYRAFGVIVPIRDNIWLEIYAGRFRQRASTTTPRRPPAGGRPYPADSPAEMQKYLSMGEKAYLAEKHAMSSTTCSNNPRYGFLAIKTLRRVVYYWTGYWSFSADELRDQPFTPGNVFYVSTVTLFMLLGIRSLWRTESHRGHAISVAHRRLPDHVLPHASHDGLPPAALNLR